MNKLLLMIGTAVLVVATLLLLLVYSADKMTVLLGVIVLMALVAAAVALAKYRSVEKRVAKLPEEYRSAYLGIHELLGTYEMTGADRQNILSMILVHQPEIISVTFTG